MPTRKRPYESDEEDVSLEGLEAEADEVGQPPPPASTEGASVGPPLEGGDTAVLQPPLDGTPPLADGWSPMSDAPRNGKPALLVGLIEGVPLYCDAYLHNTRVWRGSLHRWVPYSEWRILNTPNKVPFEPLAWTRYQ